MDEQSNPGVSVKVPAVQFEPNKDLQSKGSLNDGDSGFLRFRHKVQPKGTQAHREILNTLFATKGGKETDFIDKLIIENILYQDFASLTMKDLELMGFKLPEQREELLAFFPQLPNQDLSLKQIYHLKEAFNYNNQIINNANDHLDSMCSSLAAADFKLQLTPPEDEVVGEKYYASRFVVEALRELVGVADEIKKEISEVESLVSSKPKPKRKEFNPIPKSKKFFWTSCLILGSLSSIGVLLALYLWKYRK